MDTDPSAEPPSADPPGTGRLGVANLRDQLQVGLRTRLPEEFEFIDRVVELVEQGHLPLSLVTSTFLWARKKQPYPYPYFERALHIRAAESGITL